MTQAETLFDRGKYAEAQPLYEKALEIRRRLLTDDHPDTALSYNDLAYNLNAQRKYAEAQPLYEKALEIRRRLLTDDHRDTALSYNNLAANLNAQGKYAEAQPLFEKALEIRRRLLTDDHLDTAGSYNNAGVQPQRPGEVRRGPAALRQGAGDPPPPAHRRPPRHRRQLQLAWRTTSTLRGSTPRPSRFSRRRWRSAAACSPTTTSTPAAATTTLAVNLDAQGKYAAAEPLAREGAGDLPPTAHRRPPRHRHELQQPGVQPCTHRGSTPRPSRSTKRRWRSAAACSPTTTPTPPSATTTWRPTSTPRGSTPRPSRCRKGAGYPRRLLTDDHPLTATSYNNVAINLMAQGKYAEAQPLFEKALEIKRQLLTDDHPGTATSYNNLAGNLSSQGKYAGPSRCSRRRWRSRVACSPTTTPTRPTATTTWLKTCTIRGSTPRPSRSSRWHWRSTAPADRRPAPCGHHLPQRGDQPRRSREVCRGARPMEDAVKSLDTARLRVAFTGLERASDTRMITAPALAAVLARLGQPGDAWQSLEEDLGRGLLDELAARRGRAAQTHRASPTPRIDRGARPARPAGGNHAQGT